MASVGNGIKGYVMRIKQEWYDEDQKSKQQVVDDMERSIKQDAMREGLTGEIKIG
jgi:hypothetical protein